MDRMNEGLDMGPPDPRDKIVFGVWAALACLSVGLMWLATLPELAKSGHVLGLALVLASAVGLAACAGVRHCSPNAARSAR